MSQSHDTIELRSNRSGQLRAYLAGTRVRVQDVYVLSQVQGKSPEEIILALPHLTLSQVNSALAYYFGHAEEILGEMREDEERAASIRTRLGEGPLESRLRSAE
jgi:uncharacterized protein (DUF433 family)